MMKIKFEYVDVVGEGCEGWINLFYGGRCAALVRDVELAESIKSTTPKMCIVSDEQSDPHDDTCPVCLDEGFSTDTGDKLGRECGLCGSTGNIQ